MKMLLLGKLSEVSINLLVYFLKKIVVLKDAFYSNPISRFKHLQRRSFWGNLQIFRSVIAESVLLKLALTFPENLLFINVLTDSFIYILFKILEFNLALQKETICENII